MFSQLRTFIKRKTSQQYKFDLQYARNQWDSMASLADLGRYSIIVGLVKYFCPGGRVLDLGCGEGILQEKFSPADYTHFTGVDFSRVAIDRASAKALPNTTYLVGDLNALDVPGVFDVIIYNESIYYMDDPEAAIKRLLPQLAPGGIIIISQVDKHGKEQTAMWDLLNPTLDLAARNKVTNAQGYSWTIHVYKPRQ